MTKKPLGYKNYGSIPHLPNSRLGPGDHQIHEGQARICTVKKRDKHDEIIVQEKLDGSNVGVALVSGEILSLGRAGYLAQSSRFEQHQLFAMWVRKHEARFREVLKEGERVVGEWLAQAHGIRYNLRHEPFVAFDIMTKTIRLPYDSFIGRVAKGDFAIPNLVHRGDSISVGNAILLLGGYGSHGAVEPAEGLVYRVERDKMTTPRAPRERRVDFLAKYVRASKIDGCYLSSVSGKPDVWNWRP